MRLISSHVTAAALAASTLAVTGSAQLTLDVQPAPVGPGDDLTIVLDGGTEGDYSLVLVSLDPGPIVFPFVGTLEVGLDSLTIYPFGQFDSTGHGEFPCALDCFAATVDPFYMQAISIRLTANGPTIPEISNPFILAIDDNYITDCNGNQVDDDCDIDNGEPDCNENGIPDTCDIRDGRSMDTNQNGLPDECELCVAPANPREPGRWKLSNKVNGAVAPPLFGLRFDGLLDNDCDNPYTFDVEHPGSEVFIDYDGETIRLHGLAWGGLDVGSGWDPMIQGYLAIDVSYDTTELRQTTQGYAELIVPHGASSSGTLTWLLDGTLIPVSGKSNTDYMIRVTNKNGFFETQGWFELGDGCTTDIAKNEVTAEDTCDCGEPVKADNHGVWQLTNKVVGAISPPHYGLRLDGLFGDYPNRYTFDFERPGTAVFVEYDGNDLHIYGTAYGGQDIGSDWDPNVQGYLLIDMVYGGMSEDASGCELLCPSGAPSSGTVTWMNDGTSVPIFGKDNGSYQMRFFADGQTVDLAGWVQYSNGKPGCCQDFSSDGGFAQDDCPEDPDPGSSK